MCVLCYSIDCTVMLHVGAWEKAGNYIDMG